MLFRLRGFEDGYMDLAADPAIAGELMERVLEMKLAWWGAILPELGDAVDVVGEADDLGGQSTPLFAPRTYRELVKPLHAELFAFIRSRTRAKILFHSCGAIRELLPDLVEIGVDILNPVQVSATGMETAALKRDFGRDLVFWGGGVDTQGVLGSGTPDDVRAEVTRRVADLAPGGGFVFASVHNIQANVPAENVAAMWEAAAAEGAYPVSSGAPAAAGARALAGAAAGAGTRA
jgi:uroporphyrinogen decarboxylase